MEGLKGWGVPESRIFFEAFGQSMKATLEKPPAVPTAAVETVTAEITFTKTSQTLTWNQNSGSILEFAEAHDLHPDYSCRQGICGTCMCKIQEGAVEYLQPPTAEIAAGSVLICISQPKTAKIVLEL